MSFRPQFGRHVALHCLTKAMYVAWVNLRDHRELLYTETSEQASSEISVPYHGQDHAGSA